MAIAHATAHTIIRVKTSDDAIVVQRSIRKLKYQPACSRRLWKRCLYVECMPVVTSHAWHCDSDGQRRCQTCVTARYSIVVGLLVPD